MPPLLVFDARAKTRIHAGSRRDRMDGTGEILYFHFMSSSTGPGAPRGGGELIEPRANDRLPRGIACEGGFRLLGTPLGFRGSAHPGLLFYSGLDDPPPGGGQRLLATPFAAAAIDAAGRDMDVLALDYERTVRLGRMDIRLLPSGLGPGSALLEVSFRDRRILYCGAVRAGAPLLGPAAAETACDLLLLDAAPAAPRGVAPRTAAHRLEAAIRAALAEGGVAEIACGTRSAALEAASVAGQIDAPLVAHRPIFEMLRRVERFGLSFPNLRRLEQDWPRAGMVLRGEHSPAPAPGKGDPVRAVRVGPAFGGGGSAGQSIRLAEGEGRRGLVAFALGTGAGQIAVGPACDAETAAALERSGAAVCRVSRPTQIPLPLL